MGRARDLVYLKLGSIRSSRSLLRSEVEVGRNEIYVSRGEAPPEIYGFKKGQLQ